MQLESARTFRRRQFVFPVAIIAVAIGLYIWGIRVEAENERQLREQTQQFIDSLNNPQGAGDLLAGIMQDQPVIPI